MDSIRRCYRTSKNARRWMRKALRNARFVFDLRRIAREGRAQGRNASRQWERNLGNLRRRNTFRHSFPYCTIVVLEGAI
jgi:hypothetical protein